jgi:hypothetical protein
MRLVLAALLFCGTLFGRSCLADEIGEAAADREPTLYFHASADDPAFVAVDLENLPAEMIEL